MTREPVITAGVRPKGERRRSNLPTVLLIMAVLAAMVAGGYWFLLPRSEVLVLSSYQTAPVESGTLSEYARVSGTLVPRIERNVLAPADGVITEWLVAEGDEVAEGQILGRMDSSELSERMIARRAELEQAERRQRDLVLQQQVESRREQSELQQLGRDLSEKQSSLTLTESLWELGVVSAQELQIARVEVRETQSALDDARADQADAAASRNLTLESSNAEVMAAGRQLEQAITEAEAGTLRAPLTGRIVSPLVAEGVPVTRNSSLITIAATEGLRVSAQASEAQVRRLQIGQPAKLLIAGGSYAGTLTSISQQAEVNPETGASMVTVMLEFDEEPAGLRLGTSVTAEIEVARRDDSLYLPRGAFLASGQERMAFVVQGSEAHQVPVTYGILDGNRIEVVSGLQRGDLVVTSSYDAYRQFGTVRLAPGGEVP